ncbi:MAG: ATP-binding protein [Streptosporangiaceae bacterium]
MTPTPVYRRATSGRLIAGVCRGLAAHVGLRPIVVRLAFAVLTLAGGIGILAYLAFWALVPAEPVPPDAKRSRLREWSRFLLFGVLTVGGLVALGNFWAQAQATWAVVLVGLGAAILWQRADPSRREQWLTGERGLWPRAIVGGGLVAVGIVGLVAAQGDLAAAREGLLLAALVVAGLGITFAPWWLRMARDLRAERVERIRSQERAELAAHLHDSVLHTLALLQRNADDAGTVRRLARAQERELRSWLYGPGVQDTATFAAAVEGVAAEVEDIYGVPIEVVHVGDCPVDDALSACLQAAREAMVNAAKYAGATSISVYAEVESEQVTIFVRDKGKGFDLDAVSPDRYGVRESIVGRMRRAGGEATVRTAPGEGTEVQLELPRRPSRGTPRGPQ